MDTIFGSIIEIQRWLYFGATGQLRALTADTGGIAPLAAMAMAAMFGAVHALMPGHGKSVLVSFHAGQQGRLVDGFWTSAILTLTHVGTAIILVATGFLVLQRTLAGAGRSTAFETTSAALVALIGIWLLYRAIRPRDHVRATDGRLLALGTGLIPCPLTTFIMAMASTQGTVGLGLLLIAGMTTGMIFTIALFAVGAALFRQQLLLFLDRTATWRTNVGRGLEFASAGAVIGLGFLMLLST